jgi:predicted transcriptional regulator
MVHTIGVFGKTIEELKQEMKLDDFLFKFNLDFLIQNGFIEEKDGKLKLTQDGIELLESG